MSQPALHRLCLCLAAALAVLALCCGLSWSPDLADRLRDDAYYEFAWAANVAAGNGPTVSDGVTTSGVQLLWTCLLVPLAWWFGAASLPLLAPWLGLGLHLLTALRCRHLVRDRLIGWTLSLCWFAQPLLLRECQNGQETALACLCALQLWLLRRAGTVRFASWSLLATFARSDLLALVVVLAWRRGAAQLLVPAVALLAFVLVNLALGGGPWPDSALPMAWLWHSNFAATEPTLTEQLQRQWWFLRPVLLGGPWQLVGSFGAAFVVFSLLPAPWPRALRWLPLLAVGGAALLGAHDLLVPALVCVLLALLPRHSARGGPRELLLLTLALGAIVVVHWAVRWYPRDYYLAPLVLLPFVAIARAARWRWLLLAFVCGQAVDTLRFVGEPLRGQQEMELAGLHLGAVLPDASRVGCFNSGIVTFLQQTLAAEGQQRGVVNLDGVVDRRAFAALQRGELRAWLHEQQIHYLLDNEAQFSVDARVPHASGRWFAPDFDPARELVEVARFDVPDVGAPRAGADGFRLYQRRDAGAPPPAAGAARWLSVDARGGAVVLVPLRAGSGLQVQAVDGSRRTLATVDVATSLVMRVAPSDRGTGRLFVVGEDLPVLVLPPL